MSSDRGEIDELGVSGDWAPPADSLMVCIGKRLPSADALWRRRWPGCADAVVTIISVAGGQSWPMLTLTWRINWVIVYPNGLSIFPSNSDTLHENYKTCHVWNCKYRSTYS